MVLETRGLPNCFIPGPTGNLYVDSPLVVEDANRRRETHNLATDEKEKIPKPRLPFSVYGHGRRSNSENKWPNSALRENHEFIHDGFFFRK
jgi:hypothetical protein